MADYLQLTSVNTMDATKSLLKHGTCSIMSECTKELNHLIVKFEESNLHKRGT